MPTRFYAGLAFVGVAIAGGLGVVACGYAVAALVGAIAPEVDFETALVGGMLLGAPFAFWGQYVGMRGARRWIAGLERRRAARDVLDYSEVPERFTLYLRAFGDDALDAAGAPGGPIDMMRPNRLESALVEALAPIGPVLAVGAPGEPLPQTGARRMYFEDHLWRERVESLMRRARAVVIMLGESEGVWWEVERALALVPRERLLIVFPLTRAPGAMIDGFYAKGQEPAPRRPAGQRARLAKALEAAGASAPEPAGRDHALIVEPDGAARYLTTRMRWRYWPLRLNPLALLVNLIALIPAFPWRFSAEGEVDYAATLRPFLRRV